MPEYRVLVQVVYPYRTATGYGAEIVKRTMLVSAWSRQEAIRKIEEELRADEYVTRWKILSIEEVKPWSEV